MTAIALSRLHFPVTTLGPGRRIGVWFQGCSIHCLGCISPDTWKRGPGVTTVEDCIRAIAPWAAEADGLTVSGGEPFEQTEALEALLRAWRALAAGDVLLFSGYPYETIERWMRERPGLADALVAGPYVEALPQTRALRGSDNQTLHLMTPKGVERFGSYERPVGPTDRRLDVMLDEDGGAWFAGIPDRDDFTKLRGALTGESL